MHFAVDREQLERSDNALNERQSLLPLGVCIARLPSTYLIRCGAVDGVGAVSVCPIRSVPRPPPAPAGQSHFACPLPFRYDSVAPSVLRCTSPPQIESWVAEIWNQVLCAFPDQPR